MSSATSSIHSQIPLAAPTRPLDASYHATQPARPSILRKPVPSPTRLSQVTPHSSPTPATLPDQAILHHDLARPGPATIPHMTSPNIPQTPSSAAGSLRHDIGYDTSSRKRDMSSALIAAVATALFVVTAWFARATFSSRSSERTSRIFKSVFHINSGDTLTILTILSGVMTRMMYLVLDNTLEAVQWSLIGRKRGESVLTVLALSPTTGVFGTAKLLTSRLSRVGTKCYGTAKVLLRIAIWGASVVLFINTSLRTVYETKFDFQNFAGVGNFRGAYVDPYLELFQTQNNYSLSVVPYTSTAPAYNLVVNPLHSVVSEGVECDADECESYILPGGLSLVRPLPPTNYTSDPIVILDTSPSIHLDFRKGLQVGDSLEDADCDLFYQDRIKIAMKFCVAPSRVTLGSYIAGVYACNNGTWNGQCYSVPYMPNLTTTFSIYSRQASTVNARANFSILSITDMTPAVPQTSLDLAQYKSALRWLLNFTDASIPAPSSIVEYFWASRKDFATDYWSPSPRFALQSIIAYPLWLFNDNNAGNIALLNVSTANDLPDIFIVNAHIASPLTKIVVNPTTFLVFVILESIVLALAWLTIIVFWTTDIRLPEISAYPLIDFAFKTKHLASNGSGVVEPVSRRDMLAGTSSVSAGDKEVREVMVGERISFRADIDEARGLLRRRWRKDTTDAGAASLLPKAGA